jgi:hypothetical protein
MKLVFCRLILKDLGEFKTDSKITEALFFQLANLLSIRNYFHENVKLIKISYKLKLFKAITLFKDNYCFRTGCPYFTYQTFVRLELEILPKLQILIRYEENRRIGVLDQHFLPDK